MIKKRKLYTINKKNNKKRILKEYDFYRFTEFNPEGIENLLNLSFKEYFSIEDLLNKNIESGKQRYSDYYEYFKDIFEINEEANEVCLKKIQYVTLYKLNWNIPEKILDNLHKILFYEFHSVFDIYFFVKNIFRISPVTFNFFIEFIFPDLLTVFLSNIIRRTPLGNAIAEKGYIDFHRLDIWANLFKENILNLNSEFNKFQKGIIWDSVVEDKRFVWNLTFEDKDIIELINNEVYFDKYLGMIEKDYSERKYKKERRKLKKSNSDKENLEITNQELQNVIIKWQKENEELREKIKNKKYPKKKEQAGRPTNIDPIEIFERIIQKRKKCDEKKFNVSYVNRFIIEKEFGLSESYLRSKRIKKYLSCVEELKDLIQSDWQRIINEEHLEIMKEKGGGVLKN